MKRFLVSRLSALGDVVCSLPAAAALKSTWPDCHVTWAVDPRFAGIVECCAAVDLIVRTKPGFSPSTWPRFEGEFDAAFDLQGLAKSALVVARAGAKEKLGYHWQREGAWLFSSRVIPDSSSHHVVDQYVDVVRAAGAEADRAEFMLGPRPEDIEAVRAKLPEVRDLVIVNPGAGWVTKRWPPERFAVLIDSLQTEGLLCALIGGKASVDREAAMEVSSRCASKPVDLVGQTSVRELVALIGLARAHVGGDTGSTHIAAALGVPAIGLYSITRPQRSCPYGQIDRCHYDARGLASIEPADVLKTVRMALQASRTEARA